MTVTTISPGQSIAAAMRLMRPGDTLVLHGGRYVERVVNPTVTPATATAPITVRAADGERPVIEGLLWVRRAHHWVFDGINVTWSSARNRRSEHMVKLQDCTGIRLTRCELWGARSYAALLIAGTSSNWRVDNCHIHDTAKSNSTNQDHLIYVNSPGPGRIDNCLLVGSPNGRGVKIGPPSSSSTPLGYVTISQSTLVDNLGPSNVQVSYSATGCVVERCILVHPKAECVTPYNLNGRGNLVRDCIGWKASAVVKRSTGLADGGGNRLCDPALDAAWRATAPDALGYGWQGR